MTPAENKKIDKKERLFKEKATALQNKVAAANARATEQDGQHRGKTIGAAAVQSRCDDAGNFS